MIDPILVLTVVSQEARNLLGLGTIVLCLTLYFAGRIYATKRGWRTPEVVGIALGLGGAGLMWIIAKVAEWVSK